MQIIDGKQVASQVLEEVERDIARLREQGITPGLAVVLVGEDPASQVYVNSKVKKCAELGMNSRKIVLPSDASQEELLQVVRELNVDPAVHGILVQSPPPPHIDEAAVVLERMWTASIRRMSPSWCWKMRPVLYPVPLWAV